MTYFNPWLYKGSLFDSEHIEEYFGFCYLITNLSTGKMYIGRKYFFSNRKDPKKKRKRIIKESNWKDYYGSNSVINEEIESGLHPKENFKREILSLHKTKGMVNFYETQWQFDLRVLTAKNESGDRLYYNEHILSRYYSKNIKE